ncbi:MAG: hypothetical protein Q9M29_04650, partial [Mariprofundaceae bacterium]|nr:hypothetical protein [Mariprofundaceae bacterium]
VAALGFIFAYIIYRARLLSARDAWQQFPGLHRFLAAKWYFDELYSVMVVRPGLAIAGWCRAFDTYVIDGIVNWLGRRTVTVSWVSGLMDKYVVDGLVNLLATVFYGVGRWFRTWQTGYLRSYVVFLVLAAMSLFAVLLYFATQASTG